MNDDDDDDDDEDHRAYRQIFVHENRTYTETRCCTCGKLLQYYDKRED